MRLRFVAATLLACLAASAAVAQTPAPVTVTPALPPGLGAKGVGTPAEDRTVAIDEKDGNKQAAGEKKPKRPQADGVNSYVRIGPFGTGQERSGGQATDDQSAAGRGATGPGTTGTGDRQGRELFKIGGNIKF
jgi:hypothetical protein